MDAEQIQAAIDAGISSGMAALVAANDLKITTLMFGIVIAFVVVLALIIIVVLVVIVFSQRNQKAAHDTSRAAVNTATDLRIEAAALRASQTTVLENDSVRSKAQTALAQGVEAVAAAVERITVAVTGMGKSLDTVSGGQMVLGATAQGTSADVKEILALMIRRGVKVDALVKEIMFVTGDVRTLAQYATTPTDAGKEAVKDIAEKKSGVPATATQETAAVPVAEPA